MFFFSHPSLKCVCYQSPCDNISEVFLGKFNHDVWLKLWAWHSFWPSLHGVFCASTGSRGPLGMGCLRLCWGGPLGMGCLRLCWGGPGALSPLLLPVQMGTMVIWWGWGLCDLSRKQTWAPTNRAEQPAWERRTNCLIHTFKFNKHVLKTNCLIHTFKFKKHVLKTNYFVINDKQWSRRILTILKAIHLL